MERLWPRTFDQQIAYHLDDGRAPEFDKGQPTRIWLARQLLDKIITTYLADRPLKIIELGCGAGDISGPWSDRAEVHGYDVTPAAQEACERRWPDMIFRLQAAEEAVPQDCDVLILCEFLEHVVDPREIVRQWGRLAKFMLIGHPLYEPNPPYESGHMWSYTQDDWYNWFTMAHHAAMERFHFPMGVYSNMVLGYGGRDVMVVPA